LEFHDKAPQATASEGLAQGPYVVARANSITRPFVRKVTNLPMSQYRNEEDDDATTTD